MRSYPSVILHNMEGTLGDKEQLKKCFNLDFSSPPCLRIAKDLF